MLGLRVQEQLQDRLQQDLEINGTFLSLENFRNNCANDIEFEETIRVSSTLKSLFSVYPC